MGAPPQTAYPSQPIFSDGPHDSSQGTGSEHTAERIEFKEFKVERKSYEPQNGDPRNNLRDAEVAEVLAKQSIPFPVIKLESEEMKNENNDVEQEEIGESKYLFGTRLLFVKEYDEDMLVVRENRSYGQSDFDSYVAANVDKEWNHIQKLLRTSHKHLPQQHKDPVQALSDIFVEIYKRQFEEDQETN